MNQACTSGAAQPSPRAAYCCSACDISAQVGRVRAPDMRLPLQRRNAEATAFEQSYAGVLGQVRAVRADMSAIADDGPICDDMVLLASELAENAILHSRSGQPCGSFSVRATLYADDYAWVEIIDQGGEWTDNRRGHGLAVVAAVAGEENWGIDGDAACRVAWFRLNWPKRQDAAKSSV